MKISGTGRGLRIAFRTCLLVAWAAAAARGQDAIKRVKIDLAHVEELARHLASQPHRPEQPEGDDAAAMKRLAALEYDAYRAIRFLPEQAIWKSENLNFQMHLFHPGYLFTRPVHINEFTRTHCQRLRFVQDLFDYSRSGVDFSLPPTLGYAGFRLHYPLNRPEFFDELIVFQGASYYRALGKDNVYGLSSRGIAIDCAIPNVKEEFPEFREFWVGKPEGAARQMTMYALMDSESLAGAYQFDLAPGDPTVIEVRATLFFRKVPRVLGVSPFSSMFWFGENTRQGYDDYRPEVHDSDGLAILSSSGERLWRPAANNPPRIEPHAFRLDGIRGFGLVQRDRDFEHYQDLETRMETRPSVWIEPKGDWGPGHVELVQIPTQVDIHDNIVSYWTPDAPAEPGTPIDNAWRMTWYSDDPNLPPAGRVVATRRDRGTFEDGQRFVIDFASKELRALPAETVLEGVVTVGNGELLEQQVVKNPVNGQWRLTFQVRPEGGMPVEMRAFLRREEEALTETWSYVLEP